MLFERRALYIPLANLWFIVSSTAILFGLPNLLTAAEVGDYGVATRLISILNLMVFFATTQTVSKNVSQKPDQLRALRRAASLSVLVGAGALSLLLFLLAGPLARALGDGQLAPLLRAVAIMPTAFGIYAVELGVLNGKGIFGVQASLDALHSTLRFATILGAALLGFGVQGCVTAFVASLVAATLIAVLDGRRRFAGPPSLRFAFTPLIAFAAPVFFQSGLTHSLLSADLLLLKALASPEVSSSLSGTYFALLNIAFLPYTLIGSINLVVFPMIARATVADSRERLTSLTRRSLQLALFLASMIGLVAAASPRELLGLLYPTKPEFLAHSDVLVILAIAYCFLCVFSVLTTTINAAGRPVTSLLAAAVTLALQCLLCLYAVPKFGLLGAAASSAFAFAIGACSLLVLLRGLGLMPPIGKTLTRTALAAALAWGLGRALPASGTLLLLEAPALAGTFLAILVLLREISVSELRGLVRLARPSTT